MWHKISGDTQLILHAYTNLYESVKADINMNGSEKQKKLEEYEKKIKNFLLRLEKRLQIVVTQKHLLRQQLLRTTKQKKRVSDK